MSNERELRREPQSTALEVWERYFDRLVRQIRRWYGHAARPAKDEEDLAAEVLESICLRMHAAALQAALTDRQLWGIVRGLAERRFASQFRDDHRQKREHIEARVPLESVAALDPEPVIAIELREELLSLARKLRDETLSEIVFLRADGYSKLEVAESLGITVRSVNRKLAALRGEWRKRTDANDSAQQGEAE